jgi:hypothetical protein
MAGEGGESIRRRERLQVARVEAGATREVVDAREAALAPRRDDALRAGLR